jgi:hypothetical protein
LNLFFLLKVFTLIHLTKTLYIKTEQGIGTDDQASGINYQFPNGGGGNGNARVNYGIISWTPTTAGTYYYQCSVHNDIYGTITIQ